RFEVSRRDIAKLDGEAGGLRLGTAPNPEISRIARPAPVLKRQQLSKAGRSHTGQLDDPAGNLVVLPHVRARRHALADVIGHDIASLDTEVRVPETNELANEKSGANGQDERECDLDDDEGVPLPPLSNAHRHVPGLLKGRMWTRPHADES